ncbi:O-antigen ligase family protein [Xanthobacter sp. 126]|uniref:O-antigen ligase family protein n=1 Tax=Xanthobacter sp. 126 TaxID=1131814 RepID=UPI00045E7ADF|nr:O-antigen ligase family protein [Xanthobacter sp. 126]
MEVTAETPADAPAEEPVRRRRVRSFPDRIGFWFFLAMVILAPVPDGSIALLWIQVWTGFATVAVLLISYREASRGAVLLLGGLLVVLAAYGLVAYLQSISPGPSPLAIWSEAGTILGIEIAPLSGSVRHTPLIFLGRPLLAALVLTVAIVIGSDRQRAGQVLRAIVGAACLYGLVGFIGFAFDAESLRPFDQSGALTTFFLNKNTSAIYLGSAFLIVLAMLLPPAIDAMRERKPLSSLFTGPGGRRRAIAASAGLFVLVLLPLTLSRAGVILTLLAAIGAVVFKLRLRKRASIWKLVFGILVLLSLIYGISGGAWRERQARIGFDSLGRFDAYGMMLDAVKERPLIGYGLGSFSESFPQFRTEDLGTSAVFDIGHSTAVELIFEGGYPLALLVFAYVALCGGLLVRGAIRRPSDPYILAGLLVGLIGLVHTSFDFSLQIPGFLIIYLSVVGIGIGRSFLPLEERKFIKTRVVRRPVGPSATGTPEAVPATSPAK